MDRLIWGELSSFSWPLAAHHFCLSLRETTPGKALMVIRTERHWGAHGGHVTHLGLRDCECEKRSLGSTLHLEGGRGGSWGSWSEPGGEDGEDEGSCA